MALLIRKYLKPTSWTFGPVMITLSFIHGDNGLADEKKFWVGSCIELCCRIEDWSGAWTHPRSSGNMHFSG
jgi:hypothetical protein